MRFRDLIEASIDLGNNDDLDSSSQDSEIDNSTITALSVIQTSIKNKNLNPKVKLSTILQLLTNVTKLNYTKEDLIDIKERNETVAGMLKNIDDNTVEFITDENQVDASTDDEEIVDMDATDIPQNTVSNMAKNAMRNRQN